MKRAQQYRNSNEPLGRVKVVEDFLPPPNKLVLKEDGVKVTIALSRRSVAFFKERAADAKVPYQKMIRALLDTYTDRYEGERRLATTKPRRVS